MFKPRRLMFVLTLAAAAVPASAADAPLAPVWASEPLSQVICPAKPPQVDGAAPLANASWQAAETIGPFSANAILEPEERRTEVRLLLSCGALYLGARCYEKNPALIKPDADLGTGDELEVVLAQGPAKAFPLLHLQVSAAGKLSLTRQLQPCGVWAEPLVERPALSLITARTGIDERGWWLTAALPLEKLGFASLPAFANILRRRSEDRAVASWVDLFGGRFVNPSRLGLLAAADAPLKPLARLKLPATLAVGVNTLEFGGVKETFKVVEAGTFEIIHPAAGQWSADVRRPVIVSAKEAFSNPLSGPLAVEVALSVAETAKVALEVAQNGKSIGQKEAELAAGKHAFEIPLAGAQAGEVLISVKADVPLGSGHAATFEARHWCVLGEDEAQYNVFRPGIEKLPLRSLYRAAAVDAVTYARLSQSGEGRLVQRSRLSDDFTQAGLFLPALLYKARWPDVANPYKGDKRLLDSVILGIDSELDPVHWQAFLNFPPNRDLEGVLLAYDLVKDDVPAAKRDAWHHALERLIQSVVCAWVEPMTLKTSAYSEDIGTGTNHYAYHIFNVWLAGRALGREDWESLGRDALRRLARHERDGQWPERRGVPACHYSFLTLHNVALYYLLSGDEEVRDAVLRAVRFAGALSVATGDLLTLFDGRNNSISPPATGDIALALTPSGRALARTLALRRLGPQGLPRRFRGEMGLYLAAAAALADDGGEKVAAEPSEFTLLDGRGVVEHRHGFVYGMSAICAEPIHGFYRLDPQNAVEVWHEKAGWILKGCNSQDQPEAGSFFRKAGGHTAFLPVGGTVERTALGHAARLDFGSFKAHVLAAALDKNTFEVRAEVGKLDGNPGAVVFNFFPGVDWNYHSEESGGITLSADRQTLTFRNVTIAANQPVRLERDLLLYNPYSGAYDVRAKPVRAWSEMELGKPLVLRITIAEK